NTPMSTPYPSQAGVIVLFSSAYAKVPLRQAQRVWQSLHLEHSPRAMAHSTISTNVCGVWPGPLLVRLTQDADAQRFEDTQREHRRDEVEAGGREEYPYPATRQRHDPG